MTADQDNAVKALAWGIANAVVGHVQSNAQVNLTITAGSLGSGLPASDVTITGTIT